MENIIALIDCDSFFASCEQANNKDLMDKPVCVLSKVADAGIVLARCKSSKAMGVKMCDPYFKIKDKYKDIVFIKSNMSLYQKTSKKVMDIIKTFGPDVEVSSIDEAYINLSGLKKLYKKKYLEIAKDIKTKIYDELKINVSIGVSTSKILAKLASDKAKKNGGLYYIMPHEIEGKIGKDPIDEVCGVGRQMSKKMQMAGVFSISDFVSKDDAWIRKSFNAHGIELKHELLGKYISKVDKNPKPPKSIQSTHALDEFTKNFEILSSAINFHASQSCKKLRSWDGFAASIVLMLKDKDFNVYYKKERLKIKTNSQIDVIKKASALLKELYNPFILYRSCGVSIEDICYKQATQGNLFDVVDYKDDKLSRVIDSLEIKFGENIIKTGWT